MGHVGLNVLVVSSTSTDQRQQTPDRHVVRRFGGTVSWWLAAERRCCRDVVSETGAVYPITIYCGMHVYDHIWRRSVKEFGVERKAHFTLFPLNGVVVFTTL